MIQPPTSIRQPAERYAALLTVHGPAGLKAVHWFHEHAAGIVPGRRTAAVTVIGRGT